MVYIFKVYVNDYYGDPSSFMGYVKTNDYFKEAWMMAIDTLKEALPDISAVELHSYQTYEPRLMAPLEDALAKYIQEDYI